MGLRSSTAVAKMSIKSCVLQWRFCEARRGRSCVVSCDIAIPQWSWSYCIAVLAEVIDVCIHYGHKLL